MASELEKAGHAYDPNFKSDDFLLTLFQHTWSLARAPPLVINGVTVNLVAITRPPAGAASLNSAVHHSTSASSGDNAGGAGAVIAPASAAVPPPLRSAPSARDLRDPWLSKMYGGQSVGTPTPLEENEAVAKAHPPAPPPLHPRPQSPARHWQPERGISSFT
jgi:hypothetical protein